MTYDPTGGAPDLENHCRDLSDAETRTEWGVRLTWDDGRVEPDECERSLAEARVRWHTERRAAVPGWRVVAAEVVTRVRVTAVGPWLPAPTGTEVTRPPQRVRCDHGTVWEYRSRGYCHPGSPNPSFYTVAELEVAHGPVTALPDPTWRGRLVIGGNLCCGGNGVEVSCPECRAPSRPTGTPGPDPR